MTFSGPSTTGAGKVKNEAYMTRFSAPNIGTLFGLQFLSFHIGTNKNCFGRILTTFPGPDPTEQAKLKIGPRWLDFGNQNVRTLFGTHFFSFLIRTGKIGLAQIFTAFSVPSTTGERKLKTGPDDSV